MSVVVYMSPISSIFQYFNDAGIVLNGGKINTYQAGTTASIATYTDATGTTSNSNPIILNSNGRLANGQIWQQVSTLVKFVITDAAGNQLGPIFDQVSGINDPTIVLAELANPTGGFGADIVANAVRSYDTIISLRAAPLPSIISGQTLIVETEGDTNAGNGYGGSYYWSHTSTAADDGLYTIKPTGLVGQGRYIRISPVANGQGLANGLTLTGMTSASSANFIFSLYNDLSASTTGPRPGFVSLYSGGGTGTSNSTSMTITGLPAEITPSSTRTIICAGLINNGSPCWGQASISSSGVITFSLAQITGGILVPSAGLFTSSGTKGIGGDFNIMYQL